MKIFHSMTDVEQREWQLWAMALGLIIILGSITAMTYFFLFGDTYQSSIFTRTMANRAVAGVYILIILFCVYIVHTRIVVGKMKWQLKAQATRDGLTDLLNRTYLTDQFEDAIVRAERNGTVLGVLLCDLDRFSAVNDLRGYQAGDEILKAVARGICESSRGTDIVSRWGGDEIVVVLTNTTREGVIVAADRMIKAVSKVGQSALVDLDMSVGIALYPDHGKTADELLKMADRALFISKNGGGKIHVGEEEYALDENAVKIVFQAVVDVQSKHILGYEALGRDPKGKLGIIEIFKRYEAVGQLTELKCLCFKRTLEVTRDVNLQRVFINVDFNMLKMLEGLTKPPDTDVILEISELEALYDVESYLKIANKWRAAGFKLAIDDFGAGFISLPFIAELVPDYIKIDRKTILQAVSSPQFRGFLKDMIQALRNYASEGIIAEGIEKENELQIVKDMGISLIQGFLLGRPHELK